MLDGDEQGRPVRRELGAAHLRAARGGVEELHERAARAFADEPDGWLLLHGSYGCGKTHLAASIVNQRLAGLYLVYVILAVLILTLELPHRSALFVVSGGIALIACVMLAKWVARCPECGLDCRYYPVEPAAGSKLMRFRSINWFAPERCPHCNADLLDNR